MFKQSEISLSPKNKLHDGHVTYMYESWKYCHQLLVDHCSFVNSQTDGWTQLYQPQWIKLDISWTIILIMHMNSWSTVWLMSVSFCRLHCHCSCQYSHIIWQYTLAKFMFYVRESRPTVTIIREAVSQLALLFENEICLSQTCTL